jgi:hypothetical protein
MADPTHFFDDFFLRLPAQPLKIGLAWSDTTTTTDSTADRFTRWIRRTLSDHAKDAQTVASIGFPRLLRYFSSKLLTSAKFVPIDRVPVPPLSAIGFSQFSEFERGDFDGITYLNTFFIKNQWVLDERIHFHELIHVVQWQLLGPERFLSAYVSGLANYGYCNNPFEVMAYNAESEFCRNLRPFDAEKFVKEEIGRIDPRQFRLGEILTR